MPHLIFTQYGGRVIIRISRGEADLEGLRSLAQGHTVCEHQQGTLKPRVPDFRS